jgi:hypothetical protein
MVRFLRHTESKDLLLLRKAATSLLAEKLQLDVDVRKGTTSVVP